MIADVKGDSGFTELSAKCRRGDQVMISKVKEVN